MYKEYGVAFKEIRLHKGLSLSELEYISGVSKSSLSQFENGHTMLSFEKLERAVEAMCMTLLDYTLLISQGEPEYFISQFEIIEYLSLHSEKIKLREIYEINLRNGEKATDLIALCAKASYSDLCFDERKTLEEYFKTGLEWGIYDFHLLLNTLEQINIDLLLDLLNDLFSNGLESKCLSILQSYRKPLVWILIKTGLRVIENKRLPDAKLLIKRLKSISSSQYFTAKIGLYFLKGCYQYVFVSKEKGEKIIKNLTMILQEIEAPEINKLLMKSYYKLKVEKE